ncbi:MAG: hypothetical protein QM820_21085 [Minicystis sp.]
MLPTAKNPTPSSNAGILALLAIIGALAALALAIVQVLTDGRAATIEQAAWWLRVGLIEAAFVIVAVLAARASRRRGGPKAS